MSSVPARYGTCFSEEGGVFCSFFLVGSKLSVSATIFFYKRRIARHPNGLSVRFFSEQNYVRMHFKDFECLIIFMVDSFPGGFFWRWISAAARLSWRV
jgi:hypothetical protein